MVVLKAERASRSRGRTPACSLPGRLASQPKQRATAHRARGVAPVGRAIESARTESSVAALQPGAVASANLVPGRSPPESSASLMHVPPRQQPVPLELRELRPLRASRQLPDRLTERPKKTCQDTDRSDGIDDIDCHDAKSTSSEKQRNPSVTRAEVEHSTLEQLGPVVDDELVGLFAPTGAGPRYRTIPSAARKHPSRSQASDTNTVPVAGQVRRPFRQLVCGSSGSNPLPWASIRKQSLEQHRPPARNPRHVSCVACWVWAACS